MNTILILTKGRVGKQLTFAALPQRLRDKVIFVCPKEEIKEHCRTISVDEMGAAKFLPEPPGIRIAAKRKWVWEIATEAEADTIYTVDDDLRFFRRDADRKPHPLDPAGVGEMFDYLDAALANYLMVGISMRYMNNNKIRDQDIGAQQLMLHGMRVRDINFLTNARWRTELEIMEDFDFLLQLLRCGQPNFVSNIYMHDQKPNAPGGCSDYRDQAMYESCARKLAWLHPGVVTLKNYAEGIVRSGVNTRLQPHIAYKKALRQGRNSP